MMHQFLPPHKAKFQIDPESDDIGFTQHWNFLVGYCRSQGYSGSNPTNLHPAFRELAELTSGQAIELKDHWELEKLNSLTGGVLEGDTVVSVGSNLSARKKRRAGRAADGRYSIPVDDSMEEMIVTVTTTRQNTKGGHSLIPGEGRGNYRNLSLNFLRTHHLLYRDVIHIGTLLSRITRTSKAQETSVNFVARARDTLSQRSGKLLCIRAKLGRSWNKFVLSPRKTYWRSNWFIG